MFKRNAVGGKSKQSQESSTARTARRIALLLVGVYATALLFIWIMALVMVLKTGESSQWYDLFKSGFLILGGGLTSIIGYYFGSRGIQEAEEKLAKKIEELEDSRAIQKNLEEYIPTLEEDKLDLPPDSQ